MVLSAAGVIFDQVACTFTPTAGSPARRGPKPPPDAAVVVGVVVGAVVEGVVDGVVVGAVVLGVVEGVVVVLVGDVTLVPVAAAGAGAGAVAGWAARGPHAPSRTAPAMIPARLRFRLRIVQVIGGAFHHLDAYDHAAWSNPESDR
jgi:LytS/YehU family sensor histidine kinase